MNKLTRKDRIINALIVVSVLVVGFVVWYLPPAIAYWRSSEVYKRYSRVEGVRATYIKDFPLNDTLTVAVTLLEATDSAGWEYLMKQLNITPEMQMVLKQRDIFEWQSPRGKPEIRAITKGEGCDTSLTENDIEICTCSFNRLQMCVFHTRTKNEVAAIRNYNYNEMTTNVNYHEKD